MNTDVHYMRWAGIAMVCTMLTGCATVRQAVLPVRPGYQPDNIFLAEREIPASLRRVVVLPLTCNENRSDLLAGRDALELVLVSEFIKTKKFEVVTISPEDLRRLTGRPRWHAEDALPNGFFEKLREAYNCDGVLFGEVTEFRGYAPMAVGWRIKLVDARSCSAVWAGDEQFDAGQPAVQAGLCRFSRNEQWNISSRNGDWVALNSPRRLAQYAAAQLLETLPDR